MFVLVMEHILSGLQPDQWYLFDSIPKALPCALISRAFSLVMRFFLLRSYILRIQTFQTPNIKS